MRIKICGIRSAADAQLAARHGADAIGLVFHSASPRAVDARLAGEIVRSLSPFVTVVGLFRDAAVEEVAQVLDRVPLHMLQFHGRESPEYCAAFRRPYLKAVAMADGPDLAVQAERYAGAHALLLDGHGSDEPGGSGRRFDWNLLSGGVPMPWILAGGLDPGNVAAAVQRWRPWAVDVSSGVESAPGVKDPVRIQKFIEEVRRVDGTRKD